MQNDLNLRIWLDLEIWSISPNRVGPQLSAPSCLQNQNPFQKQDQPNSSQKLLKIEYWSFRYYLNLLDFLDWFQNCSVKQNFAYKTLQNLLNFYISNIFVRRYPKKI